MKRTLIIIFVFSAIVVISETQGWCEWPYPEEIEVRDVYFNHDADHQTTDAVTSKSNYSTTITAPEYQNYTDMKAVAYVAGKTVNLKAGFYRSTFNITSCEVAVAGGGNDSIGNLLIFRFVRLFI